MTGQWRTRNIAKYKSFDGWKLDGTDPPLNRDILKVRSSDKSAQLIGIGESKWSSHDCGRRWTDVALQYLAKDSNPGL